MSASPHSAGPSTRLAAALAAMRRLWRRRRIAEGGAMALSLVLLAAFAAVVAMDMAWFDAGAVAAARTAFYAIAGGALALLVLPAALRRAPDAFMARYAEARIPKLDALLLSAVEASTPGAEAADGRSPELGRALAARAADACRRSTAVSTLEWARTRRALGALAGIAVLGTALFVLGPDSWRHGARLLLPAAQDPPGAGNPYALGVSPGDTSVLAGEDVRIAAVPEGFQPDTLVLASRREGEAAWTHTTLTPADDNTAFEAHLFDVTATTEYYVAHGTLRSAGHRIDVIPRPVAERIDLRYEFPDYTGREPELITGGGDIAAVRGTRVEVRVTPDARARSGRLVLDGERRVPLRPGGDGELRAEFEVAEDGRYRVELQAPGYGMAPASPEYAIVAQVDSLPTVEIVQPGRDTEVTSIQEVVIEAQAEDDVAVRDLQLVMSVNGGPDEVVALGRGEPGPVVADGHELFLEERDLAPGDLIAYYVRARDAAGNPEREVSSDIFFMDVRPFKMSFRRGSGGGGGGAGGGNDERLAAQQRNLVVALFKLLRDRDRISDKVFTERTGTLATAQTRIRGRVDAIVRRLDNRSVIHQNRGYQRMAEELPQASKSMVEVEALLPAGEISDALPAARQALLHLQRADSAFREAQVAQRQQGGGGGGSARDDLANLFRLEMDRFRSPYEDMQRGDWRPPEQRIDDALRTLRELAERHQRELERAGVRARGADGDRQRALAEELESLARELERLSRRQNSESLQASAKELEEAARALRRSADAGGARSSGGGETDGRAASGAAAQERLSAARRLLEGERQSRLARKADEALRRAEAIAEAQAGIERDVAQGVTGDEKALELVERKLSLADEVENMGSEAGRLAQRASRESEADAAKGFERAAGRLREDDVAGRIRRSGQDAAGEADAERRREESEITRALEGLRDRIASAAARIERPGGPDLSHLHEQLRRTMRGLARDQEQLADQARRGAASSGAESSGGAPDAGGDSGANAAGAHRALAERLDGLAGIGEGLARSPGLARDAESLLAAIEAARAAGEADAAGLARRHAELLATLQDVERQLRHRLDEGQSAAWASGRSEPPLSRREDVEAYYRNLSERAAR